MKKTIRPHQTLLMSRYVDKDNIKRIVVPTTLHNNIVEFYTQGGGFLYKLSVRDFKQEFRLMSDKDEERADKYLPAIAYYDNGEHQGPALTHRAWPCVANSSRWNGWAVPWFTKEIIELLWKRQYLGANGYVDLTESALTPIFWVNNKSGIFWDNNIPDYVELCHMIHDGIDYYSIDGYCWDLLEPGVDQVHLYTQQWPFVEDTQATQTDEELSIEGKAWIIKALGSQALTLMSSFSEVEICQRMRWYEENGDEMTWQQMQYVRNWLYRWENCNDA